MTIKFTKMQGLGNDFIVIDAISQNFTPSSALIKKIADRHYGVGGDGILVIEKPRTSDTNFYYRVFNADGKEAELCGNGARCIAKFLLAQQLTSKTQIIVGTKSGNLELILEPDGEVSVNMGKLSSNDLETPLIIQNSKFSVQYLSLGGSPHTVMHVDNVAEFDVPTIGAQIAKHKNFPLGTNVEFMEIITRYSIKLRIYERGVGETFACGSGACAAVIVGRAKKLLDEKITVSMPGGNLLISWKSTDQTIWIKGAAKKVFDGIWEKERMRERKN